MSRERDKSGKNEEQYVCLESSSKNTRAFGRQNTRTKRIILLKGSTVCRRSKWAASIRTDALEAEYDALHIEKDGRIRRLTADSSSLAESIAGTLVIGYRSSSKWTKSSRTDYMEEINDQKGEDTNELSPKEKLRAFATDEPNGRIILVDGDNCARQVLELMKQLKPELSKEQKQQYSKREEQEIEKMRQQVKDLKQKVRILCIYNRFFSENKHYREIRRMKRKHETLFEGWIYQDKLDENSKNATDFKLAVLLGQLESDCGSINLHLLTDDHFGQSVMDHLDIKRGTVEKDLFELLGNLAEYSDLKGLSPLSKKATEGIQKMSLSSCMYCSAFASEHDESKCIEKGIKKISDAIDRIRRAPSREKVESLYDILCKTMNVQKKSTMTDDDVMSQVHDMIVEELKVSPRVTLPKLGSVAKSRGLDGRWKTLSRSPEFQVQYLNKSKIRMIEDTNSQYSFAYDAQGPTAECEACEQFGSDHTGERCMVKYVDELEVIMGEIEPPLMLGQLGKLCKMDDHSKKLGGWKTLLRTEYVKDRGYKLDETKPDRLKVVRTEEMSRRENGKKATPSALE
ncbi:hypothetical protein PROFUN_13219 [Planoprotostelium fungivorum]|uniref:Uncharacterized protein n=1 Tax=Planoprotostelium fungivorum TaxID=1890364 RepID=A0A2P6MYT7_9EUKA|nr:hypothetical protein PROFUN_13219 [Planoprotostelium fungivorum]